MNYRQHKHTFRGKGTVSIRGVIHTVDYEIHVEQQMVDVGGGQYRPGLQSARGTALPVVDFHSTDILTLKMEDGHVAEFFWKDNHGTITVNGVS